MDRPVTKTCSQVPLSSAKASSAAPYQSCQPVRPRSCQVVPCPGSRGARTVRPAAARYSAHGRTVRGLPVKPWQTRTPTGPPPAAYGSAPGWTETAKPGADDAGDMTRIVACLMGAAQQEAAYMTAFITPRALGMIFRYLRTGRAMGSLTVRRGTMCTCSTG